MEQYCNFSGVMEAKDHFKNEASSKSLMSIGINQMEKFFFKFCIALLMAISLIACEKDCKCEKDDDPQLKIRITDIPAEYEGKFVNTNLGTVDRLYHRAHNYNQNTIVMYGEATTKLLNAFDYPNTPFTEKGEYILEVLIFEYIFDGISGENKYLWTGQGSDIIKITKETTTISFNALTKWN